jgi:hypothetical protein
MEDALDAVENGNKAVTDALLVEFAEAHARTFPQFRMIPGGLAYDAAHREIEEQEDPERWDGQS